MTKDQAPDSAAAPTEQEIIPDEEEIRTDGDSSEQAGNEDENKQEESALEKRLKDSQSKITELAETVKALKDENSQFKGRFEQFNAQRQQQAPQPPAEDPAKELEFFDSDEFSEHVYENPETLKKGFKTIESVFGKGLAMRDNWLMAELQKRDNALQELQSRLARNDGPVGDTFKELRDDPVYEDLTDEELMKVAKKKAAGAKKPAEPPEVEAREYPGKPDSGSRAATSTRTSQGANKMIDNFYDRIYNRGA